MAYDEKSIEGGLLAGDLRAIAQVVRWVAVVLTSRRFWPLRAEWLDLHQEVLLRLVESLRAGRFDAAQDFRKYAQAVARYAALQRLGGRGQEVALEDLRDTPSDPEPGPAERVATADLARRALRDASPDCRTLLRAYFYEQKSHAEIAAALDIPVGTVKSRLARCLENVHRAMGRLRPRSARGPERHGALEGTDR